MNKTIKWTGINAKASLPLRSKPDASARVIREIPEGAEVTVRDTVKGWLYTGDGYVSAKHVKSKYKHQAMSIRTKWIGKTNQAVALRLWVWDSAPQLGTIAKGETVKVLDTLEGYYLVSHKGAKGFVPQGAVKYVMDSITPATFLKQVKATQEYARVHKYVYGDSQATNPTKDGKISCDRLVSKALYDLGYTDQVKGGAALGRGFEDFLLRCGFKKSTKLSDAKAGSVLVVVNPSGKSRHVFVIASAKNGKYKRYDCGSDVWIRCKQPLDGLWMSQLLGVYNL